jgi:glutamate N-acetyltransferase/amino-acid N-acetyltransferase
MRYRDRPDLGLIVADSFSGSAGIFTRNLCAAAPVVWSREREAAGQAVLANAGQANAQTGRQGLADAKASAKAVGSLIGLPADKVLLASTGIIGQPMNMEAMLPALEGLAGALAPEGLSGFAEAILTTDTVPKTASARGRTPDGREWSLWGCAKGSGMLAPDMATMLAFALTDLPCTSGCLMAMLRRAADRSFNRLTVDGDTSTNDSAFVISSGAAGGDPLGYSRGRDALEEVLSSLARQMMRDGEGVTKVVTVKVTGAASKRHAELAARAVADSPLVKTAIHGEDANWGRVLAALGRSGAVFDPYKVDLWLEGVLWVKNGIDNGREAEALEVMRRPEYELTANLKKGRREAFMLACDLSAEYVKINGSYRS